MALSTRDELRYQPLRRELERLFGAAVRALAVRVGGNLHGAESLRELVEAEQEERGDEDEMGHGNEHRQERDAPPLPEGLERPLPARGPVVGDHGGAAGTGRLRESVEQECLLPGYTVGHDAFRECGCFHYLDAVWRFRRRPFTPRRAGVARRS